MDAKQKIMRRFFREVGKGAQNCLGSADEPKKGKELFS